MTERINTDEAEGALDTVLKVIKDVMGDDYDMLEPIGICTSLNNDLDLGKIELVALAEMLQKHYGKKVDLVNWMSKKTFDEIVALKVGDLTNYIRESLI